MLSNCWRCFWWRCICLCFVYFHVFSLGWSRCDYRPVGLYSLLYACIFWIWHWWADVQKVPPFQAECRPALYVCWINTVAAVLMLSTVSWRPDREHSSRQCQTKHESCYLFWQNIQILKWCLQSKKTAIGDAVRGICQSFSMAHVMAVWVWPGFAQAFHHPPLSTIWKIHASSQQRAGND